MSTNNSEAILDAVSYISNFIYKHYRSICDTLQWDKSDLDSEIYIIYSELINIGKLEPGGSLTYATTLVRNKFIDITRRKGRRFDSPCFTCPLGAFVGGSCTRFREREQCSLFSSWERRENTRKVCSVGGALPLDADFDDKNSEGNTSSELIDFCLRTLVGEERELFLNWYYGGSITRDSFARLVSIVRGHGFGTE